jgi:hypothetical protein|tara:strand:+ start:1555 stop:1947 length:393 start_codon:yes stop_codon:yes gene_type:complete
MAVNPDFKGGVTDDPIVNKVVDLIIKRHMQGMEKFGVTMEKNAKPFDHWIDETIEELLDAIHYLTKSKSIVDNFKQKEKQLESMLAQFKDETFKAVTEQTLPPGTQPGGANWVEPTEGELNDKNKEEEST